MATLWRDIPKYVYSRTVEHADWNTTVVRQVLPEEVRALRINPVAIWALGEGIPLFPQTDATTAVHLTESHTFGNGVILLRYGVDG
ncbi:hypothetical protein ACIHAR_31325 [Streptomyces sp. NPDC052016]|uniref:hypothetical protein n=1 Tax=Streptomyces sp. NPDC052016 TaxID=3365680 RepID=UPI0037D8FD68